MRFTLVLTLFTLIGYAADATEDLLAAVRKGDVPAVKALLDNGANVNAKSPYGATPLFFAADRGNIEMVKLLLQRGADVDVKDTFYGATALTWAAEKERIDILKLLLAKSTVGTEDVLESAIEKGNIEMVKVALAKGGIKPSALTAALMQATADKHTEIAELLRQAGAVPLPKADFQVPLETLKSYAGSYARESFEVKFDVVDGKLAGGNAGFKLTLDAVDKNAFRPVEMPAATITFNVEDGKVISLTFRRGEGEPTVMKRTVTQ
jgi:hypothetical protein